MSTEYYSVSNVPASGSPGASAPIRNEYLLIEQGFEKLPALAGNALRFVRVNAAGSALESTNQFNLTNFELTIPNGTAAAPVAEGRVYWNSSTDRLTVGNGAAALQMVDTAGTQTLTNKTISGASNTLSNIPNSALTNSSVTINGQSVSLGGSTTIGANTSNALTFSGAGDGAASGATFNGSAARTISYNSVGAPSVSGANATGTWGISISGNAATASSVTNGVYTVGAQSIAGDKTFSGLTTLTGGLTISNVAPLITMVETDQSSPAGRRRIVQDGDQFTVRRNTAAAGDFSTEVNDITSDASGNFTASGNVTAFSDERLKKLWTEINDSTLIAGMAYVKAGSYTRIDTEQRQIGVSAQSLQVIMPEAVNEDAGGMLSVAYGNAALVTCIALSREVLRLRRAIEELGGLL